MKRKELEILLSKIPANPNPKVKLEQYSTPAGIVADILFEAFARNDVDRKSVVDLGCGTGSFAIGASLLGANKVTGVELDSDVVKVAKKAACELGTDIEFVILDVRDFTGKFDTCFQNPPFGYQNRTLDKCFIEKSLEVASVIYTLHHTDAIAHVEKSISGKGEITFEQNYKFPMGHTYSFHTKKTKLVDVTLFRIESLLIDR